MRAENEVLYHTMNYLVNRTNNCSLWKLLKLLYLFDLEHLREVGVVATGKKYHAWGVGPVIKDLYYTIHGDLHASYDDLVEAFDVVNGNEDYFLRPKFKFDEDVVSAAQVKILNKLCKDYKEKSLFDIMNREDNPWHITFKIQGRWNGEILEELAFVSLEENQRKMLTSRLKDFNGEN